METRIKGATIMAENVKRAFEYKAKHKCLVCETKDETEIANQELLELKMMFWLLLRKEIRL